MNVQMLTECFEENMNRIMERGALAAKIGPQNAVDYFRVIQLVIAEKLGA